MFFSAPTPRQRRGVSPLSRAIPPTPIRAVCFDLDGVLIDTMPLHARAWQEALKPLGLRVSRREVYRWEGESGTVTARTLLSRRAGAAPSDRAIRALLSDKERRFSRVARGIRVNRTLALLLGDLRHRGIRVGLVTGTSSKEVRRVVPRRVLARCDVIVTGDRVRRGKPHPDPYRIAFRRLRVPPATTAVVENAPYGIRSARRARAGIVIALASSLPRRFLREADVIVPSVPQLATLVKQLTSDQPGGKRKRRRG